MDADGKPLAAATIALYHAREPKPVQEISTDTIGRFHFKNVATGFHQIRVSLVGFEDSRKDSIAIIGSDPLELVIRLVQTSNELEEVRITGKRPFVEQRLDRTIINPEALLSSTGGTAMDVLEKSPGVSLDQSGHVRLSGKSNTAVYIDNRPTYLTGEELQQYLRSLPATEIDRIELMTNPPSNYDVAGNGGIIVIHTKKSRSKGIHGGISLAYQQGKYGQTINSGDISINREKWAIGSSASLVTTNTFTDLHIYRKFDESMASVSPVFSQNTWIRRQGTSLAGRLNADYFVDTKSTLGVNVNMRSTPLLLRSEGESHFMGTSLTQDSSLSAINKEDRSFCHLGMNVNFRHKLPDTEQMFTIDLDYLRYIGDNDQGFTNTTYHPDGRPIYFERLVGYLPNQIHIYSAKADYTYPVREGLLLAAGVKSSRTSTNNVADFYHILEDIAVLDLEKTNHFRYREYIHAAYFNANGNKGKWAYQAGIRMEATNANGHQLGNDVQPDSTFRRHYLDFFPSLFVQYKFSPESKHSTKLNYGKRIDRPHYTWLNPFITPFDRYTYYVGNPYLKPAYIHQAELSYRYEPYLDVTFAYAKVNDLMTETIHLEDGVYYSQQGNLGSLTTKSINTNLSYNPVPALKMNLYAAVHETHTESAFFGDRLDSRGVFALIRPMISYNFLGKWTVQLDGEYQSKQVFAQFVVYDRGRINTAINYKLNAACSFNLAFNDLLYTNKNAGEIGYLSGTYATYSNLRDTRTASLSFRYRFSKGLKNERSYQGGGAQSEQQRTS